MKTKELLMVTEIKILVKELDELTPIKNHCFELMKQLEVLQNELALYRREQLQMEWYEKVKYDPPVYPGWGKQAETGYATFKTKKQALEFLDYLNLLSNCYDEHEIVWNGAGLYKVEVDILEDRRGEDYGPNYSYELKFTKV